jgi:hypothetical protein
MRQSKRTMIWKAPRSHSLLQAPSWVINAIIWASSLFSSRTACVSALFLFDFCSGFRYLGRHLKHFACNQPYVEHQGDPAYFHRKLHSQQGSQTQANWVPFWEIQGSSLILVQRRGVVVVCMWTIFRHRTWLRLHKNDSDPSSRWICTSKVHFEMSNRRRDDHESLGKLA